MAEALTEKGYEIERKRIALSEAVKKVGEYTALVRLHPEVVASVKVLVKAEETTPRCRLRKPVQDCLPSFQKGSVPSWEGS